MLLLMPDARFDGEADLEQAVVGDRGEVRAISASTPGGEGHGRRGNVSGHFRARRRQP